jgi:hypothetical protein
VCLLLWWAAAARAQSAENNLWFVRSGAAPAIILPANPFAAGATAPIHLAPNITLELGRRTDGTSAWHKLYGSPSYGFGLSLVRLPNSGENRRPVEAYTFFSWPFVRLGDRTQVTTDFGMGLSWRWKHRDDKTAEYENVLSSNLNAFLDWGFYVRYLSTPRLALYTGIDYTHRSNAGIVQPDLGINVIGPKVALQFNFADEEGSSTHAVKPPFQPAWEFVVGGMGGLKSVIEQRDPIVRANAQTFDVTAALQRHFYLFGKFAGGADVAHDSGRQPYVDGVDTTARAETGQPWGIGVYGGYEHVIARFSVLLHVGGNAVRTFADSDTRRLYTRYGWRYQLGRHAWSSLSIRAHGFRKANALEFGMGYRFERADTNPRPASP